MDCRPPNGMLDEGSMKFSREYPLGIIEFKFFAQLKQSSIFILSINISLNFYDMFFV